MTEKFIDLGPQIVKEAGGLSLTSLAHEHQLRVLEWLDEHPDQVPGRTITRSDCQKLMDDTSMPYGVGFTDGFHQAGGSIVDDPEPTNEEKLSRDIESFYDQPQDGIQSYEDGMARFLLGRGWTKAPEGES